MTNKYLTAQKTIASDPANIDREGAFDVYSPYPVTIDSSHAKLHNGNIFLISSFDANVTTDAFIDYLIITPDSSIKCHVYPTSNGTGEYEPSLYEGTTVSANGTAVSAFNRNRTSANTNTMLVYKGPTVTNAGTLIKTSRTGSGRQVGGQDRGDAEYVLKQNTKYLIRLTSRSTGNTLSLVLDWYENATE